MAVAAALENEDRARSANMRALASPPNSSHHSSSTSLTEETPPRAASPPAAQPYQALSNQKLSVQAKKVAYNVYAQVRKSDPQLSVRAACRKVSELTGVS